MSRKRGESRKARQPRSPERLPGVLSPGSAPLIVVPLDGSLEAKAALPAARLIARIIGAAVNVVHATDEHLAHGELLARVKLEREEAHGLVVDQVAGPHGQAILRHAQKKRATLIAATTRGRTAYLGRTVRPVVEQIIREAPCPVLLVRPEIYEYVTGMSELRRILLPLDGAPSSAAVIGPAVQLAAASDAEIDMLYVATQSARPQEAGTLAAPRYVDQPQHEWPAWAEEFMSRCCICAGGYLPTTRMHLFLRRGEPAAEILGFAAEREHELIVLEWRGQMDPAHANVVRGVLTNAPCPVLLLRTSPSTPTA